MMRTEECKFNGHVAKALTAQDGSRMVIMAGWGPRIASFRSPAGVEFMLQGPEDRFARGEWKLGGGGRVWTYRGPADEVEESYAPDNLPCAVVEIASTIIGAETAVIIGGVDPRFLIQRGFRIRENDKGGFDVTSFVHNASEEMLWSGGVWAIAAIDPCCFISIPTGDPKSNWEDTTYHVVWRWAGHATSCKFIREQVIIRPGLLNILPGEEEGKIMVQSPAGAIMAVNTAQQACFVKVAPWQAALADKYPAGCNLAVYSSPGHMFRESETMGPQCLRLEAGAEIHHTERWYALDGLEPFWDNAEAVHEFVSVL